MDNPLKEEKLFHFQGNVKHETVNKMRAMTIQGLCLFLDISDETWALYCKRPEFLGITERIKRVIFTQKFEGAAAELLNSNLIARELGIKDRIDDGGQKTHNIKITRTIVTREDINADKKNQSDQDD